MDIDFSFISNFIEKFITPEQMAFYWWLIVLIIGCVIFITQVFTWTEVADFEEKTEAQDEK